MVHVISVGDEVSYTKTWFDVLQLFLYFKSSKDWKIRRMTAVCRLPVKSAIRAIRSRECNNTYPSPQDIIAIQAIWPSSLYR